MFWVYVLLSDVLNPITASGDFWPEKARQLFRLNHNIENPAVLAGNAVVPALFWFAIDWGMRRKKRLQSEPLSLQQRPSSRSYLTRHWRGELSLPVAYWVNLWL